VLALGIGLIAVGLVSLIIPGVGWVLGPALVVAGLAALVLHFVRVSRAARTG
jgi:hypothetical protein